MKNLTRPWKLFHNRPKINFKMKLFALLFLVSQFQIHANETYDQKTKITLKLENVSVEKVLNKIESLTEFKFMYNDKEVDYNKIVSVRANKELVTTILELPMRSWISRLC